MANFLKIIFRFFLISILLGVATIIFFLVMDSDGERIAITAKDFLEMMAAENIPTDELSDDLEEEYGVSIEQAFRANKSGSEMVFYELTSDEDAKTLYDICKEDMKKNSGGSSSSSGTNRTDYNNFKISTTERYKYIMRIENTVLMVNCDQDDKENVNYIKSLLEKMGYQLEKKRFDKVYHAQYQ